MLFTEITGAYIHARTLTRQHDRKTDKKKEDIVSKSTEQVCAFI